jgi:hypothetical protein
MNRADHLIIGVIIFCLIFLAGCSGAAQPTVAATATAARQASANVQAPTPTPVVNQTRQTGANRPTATATAAVSPATATPKVAPATQTATAAPTRAISTAGSLPIPEKRQTIVFAANATSSVVTTLLAESQPVAYQFTAPAGQIVYLAVAGSTNLQVFDPKQLPVSKNVIMPGYLSLQLAEAGTYTVVLQGRANTVTFSLYLPPANSNLASAAPLPEKPQAMDLPVLPYTVNLPSRLEVGVPQAYTFAAKAGQVLSLVVTGTLTVTVIAPDGNSLPADTDSIETPWIFTLPESGTYNLVLLGSGVVNVTSRLSAAPAGTPLAAPQAGSSTPILIAPGQTSISLRAYFTANKSQTYVVRLPAKQVLYVNTTGSAQVSQISGPDQKPLAVNHAESSLRWSANIAAAGEYTVTLSGSGLANLTFSVPVAMPAP